MVKWLFFDLGSTLIDESVCTEYRIQESLKQNNAPGRDNFMQRMKENASLNRLPYKDTAKDFGLEIVKWPKHLERLYTGVPEMLQELRGKYKLGIIANQSLGTEERMIKYGIHQYFDVIMASAEEGVTKPDLEIFKRALRKAKCASEEAYMIGDRLDNDIQPAAELGMHTIWVKQGFFGYGNQDLFHYKPSITVEHVEEVMQFLL